mmetsp:Transcript_23365/g.28982  ORF Transcript_23365/g.28982 Transcript_23365/m.28982 type:complete len:120 (+) Transcript_23365:717-1076(+)
MMDKDFCLTKWNDEEKKQMPNVSDFIQKIEKATKVRKKNDNPYWLQKQKQARMDQVNKVRMANDPTIIVDEAQAADAAHPEDDNLKKESEAKLSKKRNSNAKRGAGGKDEGKKPEPGAP